jgi:DNA-binding transcriptional MerR regulator/methylmalonyl-CoA mutase cobalamin-binding subunit
MANYTIRDLERLSGIKAHTIRIWEKRFGLIEPERTSTNIRTYCDAELKKLLNISILNKNGFKISKIANLSTEEIFNSINKLTENPCDTESQIENMTIAMIDLDESKFEKILSKSIIQFGFEETMVKVMVPFLIRIGIMWQTGTINTAHEHFISNLIRQKMFAAIDSLVSRNSMIPKTFLLFLPEGELHELGLLFTNYLIRKRGHQVIYLGQNVPFADLVEIAKKRHVDYLVISFITSVNGRDILNYLRNITDKIPGKTIFITGELSAHIRNGLSGNVKYINSPQTLIAELETISSN